jgi:membrane protein
MANRPAILPVLKQTFKEAGEDKIPRLAAALSYYTVLSLSPLLVVAIAVAGLVFGQEAAQGQITQQLQQVFGAEAGDAVQTLVAHANRPAAGILSTVVGVVVLLFGASGVFGELQDSLNIIWEVTPRPDRGFKGMVKDRFFSFSMVLGVAFLLLVSLVISTVLAAVGTWFESAFGAPTWVWHGVNFVVSLLIIAVLFALLFKIVPDVKIGWRDVSVGAVVTALLFTVGKYLIGLYVGKAGVASPYGAAGSLMVIVIWVYYSAHLLFIGAEFTQVYARASGAKVEPDRNAIELSEVARVQQGIAHDDVKTAAAKNADRPSSGQPRPA